jgi:hydrogenase maturation protease
MGKRINSSSSLPATLIVWLGNTLMRDDGVGIFVLQQLEALPLPPQIQLANCGSDLLKILSHFRHQQKIILIDAVEMEEPPGTVRYFSREEILQMPGQSQAAHQLSAIEAIRLLESVYPEFREAEIQLIGVQPERVEVGEGLTPAVERAAQKIVQELRKQWKTNFEL